MVETIAARLREAVETGEVLGIIYHGGSQPGAFRRIVPIRVEGHQVRARCYTSNAVKVFSLAKIEMRDAASPTDADMAATWSVNPTAAYEFRTLGEIADHFRPQLEAHGWHLALDVFDGREMLGVYARLKNGRPRKTPSFSISYEAMTHDLGVLADGSFVQFNERPRVRPWSVRGNGKSSTWGRLDKAVQAFVAATGLSSLAAASPARAS